MEHAADSRVITVGAEGRGLTQTNVDVYSKVLACADILL